MKNRSWLKLYLLFGLVFAVSLASGMYIYDPMMLFHKPIGREITLHGNMRLQAAGIIKNFKHEGYILGTSMLENTSANEATKKLKINFANISMSGSSYYEREPALELLLKHGAKSVLYSLDSYYLEARKEHPGFAFSEFEGLYRGTQIDAFNFYMKGKYVFCLILWSQKPTCIGGSKDFDRPNAWISSPSHSRRFGGLDNWFAEHNNKQIKSALATIVKASKSARRPDETDYKIDSSNAVDYVSTYLIGQALRNPGTDFHLVFPPYSRIRYAQWHQTSTKDAAVHEQVVRYLAKVATENSNIFVYGYEDQDFLDDISNYKDTGHYHDWVNEMMLSDIESSRNLLTSENVEEYIYKARKKAQDFDLIGLAKKIDVYLNSLE